MDVFNRSTWQCYTEYQHRIAYAQLKNTGHATVVEIRNTAINDIIMRHRYQHQSDATWHGQDDEYPQQ
ncbi:hypothetical protein SF123566_9963 [Shigella flexneri 1235-66]|nr:hypothetical protein SF123566_9963 [Shigella flexneri 1235-66]